MSDINFLDLIMMKKVDSTSALERFGTQINTSFFETANLLGALKVKQMIEIDSAIGGSSVTLTELGKGVLLEAEEQSAGEVDALDNAILAQLGRGVNELEALTINLNVRSNDLAYHLNRLAVQHFISYNARSAKVYLSLTEKGFNHMSGAKGVIEPDIGAAEGEAASASPPTPLPAPAGLKPEKLSPLPEGALQQKPLGQQTILEQSGAANQGAGFELPDLPLGIDTKRKLSKLAHYAKKYLPLALLLLLLIVAGIGFGIAKVLKLV